MLSQKLLEALNAQITYEFFSSHLYLAAAAYSYSEGLDGFANFFIVQAEEEKFHAMKFFSYINEMDSEIIISGFENPKGKYENLVDLFDYTLEHEKFVTERLYNLMDISTEEREHATISFLKWFIDEQVEEMATFKTILNKLKRAANDPSVIYSLDAELATRVFVPPVA